MGSKKRYKNKKNAINATIAQEPNSGMIDSKLDIIRRDTDEIKKISKSKFPMILSVVGLIITVSGVSIVWLINLFTPAPENQITLFSEYSKITIYQETNMIATLNFEADSVSITAYLASGKSDTLPMSRKNSTEWEEKVIFNETGTHKIVAEATAPDGSVLEDTIEIEVIPVSFENINLDQFFQLT